VSDVHETQRLFFEALFPELDGFIELRAISRTGKPPGRRFYKDIDSLMDAVDKATKDPKGYDLYFGVLPRATEEGTKQAIKQGQTLWIDVDHDVEAAKKQIEAAPGAGFLAMVSSGRGLHAYWGLHEPIELDTPEAIAEYENRLRKGAELFQADPAACDITRVMRVPGTMNMKEGI
jgi:hypothetical protein